MTVQPPLAVAEVDGDPPYVVVKNVEEWRVEGQTDREHMAQRHAVLLGDH